MNQYSNQQLNIQSNIRRKKNNKKISNNSNSCLKHQTLIQIRFQIRIFFHHTQISKMIFQTYLIHMNQLKQKRIQRLSNHNHGPRHYLNREMSIYTLNNHKNYLKPLGRKQISAVNHRVKSVPRKNRLYLSVRTGKEQTRNHKAVNAHSFEFQSNHYNNTRNSVRNMTTSNIM